MFKNKLDESLVSKDLLPLEEKTEVITDFVFFKQKVYDFLNFWEKNLNTKIQDIELLKQSFFIKLKINLKHNEIKRLFKDIKKYVNKPESVPNFLIIKENNTTTYNFQILNKILMRQINGFLSFIENLTSLDHGKNINSVTSFVDNSQTYSLALKLDEESSFQMVNDYEKKLYNYFEELDKNIFDLASMGVFDKFQSAHDALKIKRNAKIDNFVKTWKSSKKIANLSKNDNKSTLKKFYKQYDNLKKNLEYLFWKIEVHKINFLNKPQKKIKKDKITKTFPYIESDYIIDLENVYKYYSNGVTTNRVLNNINLKIKAGNLVVILGPSGSGKTTLLNIISGMDRATFGKTIIANTNLLNLNDSQLTEFRRNNIGYIFQQYGLLPNLTVKENIEIGAFLQSNAKKRLNIDNLLHDIGMFEYRNRLPSELSGGQQQRVSILRAIAKNPKIIFGDEPTGALDEEMTQIVLEQFIKINKEHKTTVIIVTHNPLIAELATCVIRVHNGKIKSIVYNDNPKSVSEIKWSSD
ncbi:ABC transporter ATP-binding protein [Mycoplasmoides alvi]|uniref:ABC transporter ATP-binding protein n=1 Tax=Mycoplasmoides alvi TaxID=78580 RepID=UPI000699082C|nr:ABC transporter ATP-binding protein [Mycoplasmoides alvi]